MIKLNRQVEALHEAQDEIREQINNIEIMISAEKTLGIYPESIPVFEKERTRLRGEIKGIQDAIDIICACR